MAKEERKHRSDERVLALDGLRGIAILFVLVGHLPGQSFVASAIGYGDAGVVVFFVLSGYLITSVLVKLREQQSFAAALGTFYARRARRIFPIYYLVIVACLLWGYQPVADNALRLLTYTVNTVPIPGWPEQAPLGAASHLWSLSVEEQFYWLWPLVVLLAPRRRLLPIVVGLVLIVVVGKYALSIIYENSYHLAFRTVVGCADSLGLGAILALTNPRGRWAIIAAIAGAVLTVGALYAKHITQADFWYRGFLYIGVAYFHGIICLAASAIIGMQHFRPVDEILSFAPLRWTGRISYGLYIYHPFVALALSNTWVHTSQAALHVVLFATAIASWFLIEAPILSFNKKHAAPQATTADSKTAP